MAWILGESPWRPNLKLFIIRVWDLESISNARATGSESDKSIFHLDPMNEVEVEPGADLKSIAKSKIVAEDNNDWYIQDGSGSIWKVDLSFSLSMQKPSRIYRFSTLLSVFYTLHS